MKSSDPRAPGAGPRPSDTFSPYRRLPWRRRLLLAGLAAATAVSVILLMLDPPGGPVRKRPAVAAAPDAPRCAPGQADACVGSKTHVLPAAAGSTAGR